MKPREIASRITGISTPLGGLSWEPPKPDSQVVRQLFLFLEDRRVLYEPAQVEMPEHCVQSVLQIRQHLTAVLNDGGISTELEDVLRGLRGACRDFLGQTNYMHERPGMREGFGGLHDWMFNQALGTLRSAFGLQIARLAITYDVDVPELLAVTLPAAPE